MSVKLVRGKVCLDKDRSGQGKCSKEVEFGQGIELGRLNFILGRNGSGKTLLTTLLNPAITALVPTSKVGCCNKQIYALLSILGYSYLKWPLPFRTCAHMKLNNEELCVYGIIDFEVDCFHDLPSACSFSLLGQDILQSAEYAKDKPYFSSEKRSFDYFICKKDSSDCINCEKLQCLRLMSYAKQCNDQVFINCVTEVPGLNFITLYYSPHLALVRSPLNLLPFYVSNLMYINRIGEFNNSGNAVNFVLNLSDIQNQDIKTMFDILAKVFGLDRLNNFIIYFKKGDADVKVSYEVKGRRSDRELNLKFEPWQIGDGQRAFIQLFLTALAAKIAETQGLRPIFILDSPEAFMHPDLIDFAAELLMMLKSLIVVITQSNDVIEAVIANLNEDMVNDASRIKFYRVKRESKRNGDAVVVTKLDGIKVYNLLVSRVDLRKLITWEYIIYNDSETG